MGAWHTTSTDLLRSRFSALVAYANLLVDDPISARDNAQDAIVEAYSERRPPRDIHAAERAVRTRLATAADPHQAALVLQAIDSYDHDGVRRTLRKAAPDPIPQATPAQVAAMRRQYKDLSASHTAPTGTFAAGMAAARHRHQTAVIRATAGVAAGLVAAGAIACWALNDLSGATGGAEVPTASAHPAANLVRWAPDEAFAQVAATLALPACGDTYSPQPSAVGGVTPAPTAAQFEDPYFGHALQLTDGFTSADPDATFVLAMPGSYVVTRDDTVIYATSGGYQGAEGFAVNGGGDGSGEGSGDLLLRNTMCDAQVAQEELEEEWSGFHYDAATNEERAQYNAMWEEFQAGWKTWSPGTYKVYLVTPIVFGEQAALGQLFAAEGVESLRGLDPGAAGVALTREVDPATVRDVAPGVGISEPLEFVVE